jgi:hypothetical protein
MLSNYVIGLIRTYVPIGVGLALGWLAVHFSVKVDDQTEAQIAMAVGALLSAAYYTVVAAAEKKWPQFGWLLGKATNPQYAKAKDANPHALAAGATKVELKAPRPEHDPSDVPADQVVD